MENSSSSPQPAKIDGASEPEKKNVAQAAQTSPLHTSGEIQTAPEKLPETWEKPLIIASTTHQLEAVATDNANSHWPELRAVNRTRQPSVTKAAASASLGSETEIAALKEHSKEYPWAAKMNQPMRNLHRVTILEFMEDGTPKIKIPSHRGLWHFDDCLMFVSNWTPAETISLPEITTVPVWLTLKNIPYQLYSFVVIKWIASGIGEPMLTEKSWLDPTQMGEAKILVEVKLNKAFPQKVALVDTSNVVSMVDVIYSWLPSNCRKCGQLGHKASRCLLLNANGTSSSAPTDNVSTIISEAPIAIVADDLIVDVAKEREKETKSAAKDSDVTTTVTQVSEHGTTTPLTHIALGEKSIASKPVSSPKVTKNPTSFNTGSMVLSKKIDTTKQDSTSSAPAEHSIRRSSSNKTLSSNRFAYLDTSDDEEESQVSDEDSDPTTLMTPMGKRILRERPVRPSAKAKEMVWQTVAVGRGNRGGRSGRGNRGGRG
ncbi:hypothetical protein EUTSA_v10019718mg [Eutrema salsugineum]|uniref:CCHC-type domain-containing protein n=1 Tax=Eutrema salsugineum TaxID=72664 RepID=V4KC06_EUTSA|nr:hypothetical protein EUTSA_v10019718mg [Eutrema salsugineum]